MRVAGRCDICQENVYLDDWACVQGHDRTHVSGWYNSETGQPMTPDWIAPASPPPPSPSISPAEAIRALLERRISAVGVAVVSDGDTVNVHRSSDYEACISVAGGETLLTLWEYLAGGDDPGVRDVVRSTAAETGWTVNVALRRPITSRSG